MPIVRGQGADGGQGGGGGLQIPIQPPVMGGVPDVGRGAGGFSGSGQNVRIGQDAGIGAAARDLGQGMKDIAAMQEAKRMKEEATELPKMTAARAAMVAARDAERQAAYIAMGAEKDRLVAQITDDPEAVNLSEAANRMLGAFTLTYPNPAKQREVFLQELEFQGVNPKSRVYKEAERTLGELAAREVEAKRAAEGPSMGAEILAGQVTGKDREAAIRAAMGRAGIDPKEYARIAPSLDLFLTTYMDQFQYAQKRGATDQLMAAVKGGMARMGGQQETVSKMQDTVTLLLRGGAEGPGGEIAQTRIREFMGGFMRENPVMLSDTGVYEAAKREIPFEAPKATTKGGIFQARDEQKRKMAGASDMQQEEMANRFVAGLLEDSFNKMGMKDTEDLTVGAYLYSPQLNMGESPLGEPGAVIANKSLSQEQVATIQRTAANLRAELLEGSYAEAAGWFGRWWGKDVLSPEGKQVITRAVGTLTAIERGASEHLDYNKQLVNVLQSIYGTLEAGQGDPRTLKENPDVRAFLQLYNPGALPPPKVNMMEVQQEMGTEMGPPANLEDRWEAVKQQVLGGMNKPVTPTVNTPLTDGAVLERKKEKEKYTVPYGARAYVP